MSASNEVAAMRLALEALRFALHVGFDESSESQIKKGDKAVQQHKSAIKALEAALESHKALAHGITSVSDFKE